MKCISLLSLLTLVACGANTNTTSPATTPTTAAAPPPSVEPMKAPEPTSEPEPAAPVAEPEPAAPEACDGGWVCVKVSLDTRKVDKRDTKLIGDPKIESTWSKTSDGRTVTFDKFSKGAVDLMLRRKPGDKNEVVVKPPKGGEIVIDHRDGSIDDFSHIGVIAAEQDGALLVDIRYMK